MICSPRSGVGSSPATLPGVLAVASAGVVGTIVLLPGKRFRMSSKSYEALPSLSNTLAYIPRA